MRKKSSDLEAVLGDSIAELVKEPSGIAAEHPSIDDWLAYRRGDLEPTEIERLQHHLETCRSCVVDLLDLQDFVEPAEPARTGAADLAKASVWRGLRRELTAPPAWTRYGLIAALSLGLVAAASTSVSQHLQLTAALRPTPDARVIHLDSATVRSGDRRAMPSDASLVTLVLHPAKIPDYSTFRADLIDANGQEVWQGEVHQGSCVIDRTAMTDGFCIGLRRGFLPDGEFRVDLWGRGEGEWEKVDSFALLSRAERPARANG